MFDVSFDTNGARAAVKLWMGRSQLLTPVMEDFSHYMLGSVSKNFEQGGRPDKWKKSQAEKTLNDSGRLASSFTPRHGRDWALVGTNVRYARIHNEGGDIKPVKAKALAVPLHWWVKKGPRYYKDLWLLPPAFPGDARGILARTIGKGKNQKVQPMFALRGRVQIPKRRFLLFQAEDVTYIKETLERYLTTGQI